MGDKPIYLASVFLIAALAFLIIVVDPLKYPVASFLYRGENGSLVSYVLSLLGPKHYIGASVLGALMLSIIYMEYMAGSLSTCLARSDSWSFRLFLVVILAWFGQAFLYPGILLGGDTNYHVARIAHFRYGLESGFLEFWNNYWHIGMPEFQFTGSLLFWVGGVVDLFIKSPYISTKLILFLCQLGSGVFMYRYLRQMGRQGFGSLVGAVIYSGAYTHLHMLLYKGSLPQAITFLLLPLCLYLAERLASEKEGVTYVWSAFATVLALLFINHPSNGFFADFYVGLYILGCVAVGRYQSAVIKRFVVAGLAAAAMALFIVIPVYAERTWVTMLSSERVMLALVLPKMQSLLYLVKWHYGNTGSGENFFAYIGLTTALLAMLSCVRLSLRSKQDVRILVLLVAFGILGFFLTGPHIRQPIFILFFMASLAGIGADQFLTYRKGRFSATVLALVLLDLGGLAIQPVARTDKGYFEAAAHQLQEDRLQGRTLLFGEFRKTLSAEIWQSSPLLTEKVQTLGVTFAYSVPMSHNYVSAVIKRAEHDLRYSGVLSSMTDEMLSLLDVNRLICDTGTGMGFSPAIKNAVVEGRLGRAIRIDHATPIVTSASLMQRSPASGLDTPFLWDEYFSPYTPMATQVTAFLEEGVGLMDFDPARKQVKRILVREIPSGYFESPVPPDVTLLDYQVSAQKVVLRFESTGAGWARLALAWYPTLKIVRNGEEIRSIQDFVGQIVVPIKSGVNDIVIIPQYTDIRHATLAVSGLAMFLSWLLVYLIRRFWPVRTNAGGA